MTHCLIRQWDQPSVCEQERGRGRAWALQRVCVGVCVCVRERERKREWESLSIRIWCDSEKRWRGEKNSLTKSLTVLGSLTHRHTLFFALSLSLSLSLFTSFLNPHTLYTLLAQTHTFSLSSCLSSNNHSLFLLIQLTLTDTLKHTVSLVPLSPSPSHFHC